MNMHASTDIRKVKCLDGLHYSFELLDYNYSKMHESCLAINEDQNNLIPALSKCWSFVDLVHRIREIALALPGLSGKSEELCTFLNTTSVSEDFRHYIQHLRRELSKKEINNFPAWGTLSWVDGKDNSISYLIAIGAQIDGTSYSGCVYDNLNKEWVSKVCLAVQDKSFNFDPIYEECMKFKQFILPWIHSTYEPGIKVTEKSPIITMKVQFNVEKA